MVRAFHHDRWRNSRRCSCALFRTSDARFPSNLRRTLYVRQIERWILSQAVEDRLSTMRTRHDEIQKEMRSAGPLTAKISPAEISTISRAVELLEKRDELEEEVKQLKVLLEEASGVDEMEQECKFELERNDKEMKALEKKILDAILPRDEDDFSSDAVVEVRAGTGGDEASLFAWELFEAYSKAAKSMGFKVEVLDTSRSEIGGLKEGSLLISGGSLFRLPGEEGEDSATVLGPYGTFKFESGVHRVQRVRSQSR